MYGTLVGTKAREGTKALSILVKLIREKGKLLVVKVKVKESI